MKIDHVRAFFLKSFKFTPVSVAFFGSLLLSLIAISGTALIPRDAALYIDVAQQISEQGVGVAQQRFDWPWFSLLLAGTHYLLGMPLEISAYLWCAFFMAGTCALLVSSIQRITPEAGYWACLVVLSIPAFNSFRDDILREFGFWFFSALSLWLALSWRERGDWLAAGAVHLAIAVASLFRLEAIILVPVLYLWCFPDLLSQRAWIKLFRLCIFPIFGLFAIFGFLVSADMFSPQRVEYYLGMINPQSLQLAFNDQSERLATTLFKKWLHDEAGMVYGIMLVGVVGLFFLKLCGALAILFLHRSGWEAVTDFWRAYRIFALGAIIYFAVLLVFLVRQGFINPRYASYLNLLCVPLLTIGFMGFYKSFPKLGRFLIALMFIHMIANVVSLSDKKERYIEAGQWMSMHAQQGSSVYYDDGRVSYYAGWGYVTSSLTREQAMMSHADRFDYFVINANPHEGWVEEWLVENHKQILAVFKNAKGKALLIIGD